MRTKEEINKKIEELCSDSNNFTSDNFNEDGFYETFFSQYTTE